MVPPANHVARLRRCRFFHGLPDATAQRLVATATTARLAAGDRLWRLGDPARCFALVERGLVLISVPRADGAIASLGLFGPRECVGLSAALDEHARFPADAVVLTPVLEALLVPAAAVREVAREPSGAAAIQSALLDHTQALRAKIEILSAGKVPARLASLLAYLADRFGDVDRGETFIPLALSRPTLAQLVATRPETVIRTLTRWRKEGIVVADDEGILIKAPARLAELAIGG